MTRSITAAGWRFDNSYARLPGLLFTAATPAPVRAPGLVLLNEPLAAELGLAAGLLHDGGAAVFAGNELPPGAEPIAQAYAGHQFGHFTNLGDGRAILLGEQLTPAGRRYDIQLKGAGRTRYSRGGDGRAALGPMLREYIISEALHALGIPTTRSLAVVTTGDVVLRAAPLPGAVLTRVASSHIRVGTFQYAAALGRRDLLEALLDHAIARHDPALADLDAGDRPAAFLEAVIERQAQLVSQWMLVGFVHGVMNTDNMAVSGETIDYGPCAFLDAYDPATVFSSIDEHGRYASANQPGIAHWNLARLAESLLALFSGPEEAAVERVRAVLDTYPARFARAYLSGARAKLGLATEQVGDHELFTDLLERMQRAGADFSATFAGLTAAAAAPGSAAEAVPLPFPDWAAAWRLRLAREPEPPAALIARMRRANPVVIPRNHQVEKALTAAEGGDSKPLERLLDVLRDPFSLTAANQPYRDGPPDGCDRYRTFCGT